MSTTAIEAYLDSAPPGGIDAGFLAYIANLSAVAGTSPDIAKSIVQELADQRSYLKLIASENYCSLATQLAMGNMLTDKYAEGVPGQRFYEGCDNVDAVETFACEKACRLFGCEHAYVQPHSGADANLIAYWAILETRVGAPALARLGVKDPAKLAREDWGRIRQETGNQRLLGMDYYAGGHLTHGYRRNASGMMFDAYTYGVNPETGLLDYDEIERLALDIKPLILLAGYSAYPRAIDFARLRAIADKTDAVFMVDMAHFAGLVAGGVFEGTQNPVPFAHVVTSTTHKTLRGPRGGIILSTKEFAEYIDKGCPLVIGGPLPHVIAAKAVALVEADTPEFKAYARSVVENASTLAQACIEEGLTVLTGGTDNHLMLVDVRPLGLTGRQAADALRACGVTLNYNSIPCDPYGPLVTSGLRMGTPAATTLGMGQAQMREIASVIKHVLANTRPAMLDAGKRAGLPSKTKYVIDEAALDEGRARVKALLDAYPVYPELDLAFLQKHFG
ncbi:MAG TPA: glycine hydroxymethyltransferase [Candidatus Hydrogenedentes bacterium]|nr:glycine hydroxymethyltransferase [Candidatus Hydrogenedentota bacterium]